MSDIDVIVPEVHALHQKAKFFKQGDKDLIEVSFVGEKDTVVRRVTPEHMATFREEWNAYCDGSPLKRRTGTPLTDIQGMSDELAEKYIFANLHTAEEFAALSDGQCQSLGHGTLTLRQKARDMLGVRKMKDMEAATKRISNAAASVTAMPAEPDGRYASKEDLNEVKNMLAQLIEMQKPKKPGRPKKEDS